MNVVEPLRVTRSYTQTLVASPDVVFPLLCPVREAEWIPGWDPLLVVSSSGVVEPDCVFVTPASPADAIWYVTRHEPAAAYVEMIKVTPGVTACRLTIRLRRTDEGCDADVSYMHTSLGPQGDDFVRGFTEASYVRAMQQWEARLNHYLIHESALVDAAS
jgi:hypothetical protein